MLPPRLAALALAALAAPRPGWALLDCKNIRVDGHSFDLLQLKGPHSVVTTSYDSGADAHHNTTYTLDVCGNLKKSGGGKDAKAECPNGTRGEGRPLAWRRVAAADDDAAVQCAPSAT